MAVKMPTTIRIGLHDYVVKRPTATEMGDDLGGCEANLLEITVKQRLKKSKAQEILTHEIMHACTHPSFIGVDKATDEDFVTAVSPTWLQVLRDNPDLVAYLVS